MAPVHPGTKQNDELHKNGLLSKKTTFYFYVLSLFTSKVAGSFKTGEVKGCCYSFSRNFSDAVHGIHESKFDLLTVVESIL